MKNKINLYRQIITALLICSIAGLIVQSCKSTKQTDQESSEKPLTSTNENILSGAPVQKSPYPLTSSSFTDCGYNGSLYLVKQDVLPTNLQKARERLGPCLGEGTSFLCNDTLKTSCPGGSNRRRCITEEYEGQWSYQWYEKFVGMPVDYTYLDDFGTICGMSDSLKKQFDNTFPGPNPSGTVAPEPTPFCRKPCPTPKPSMIPSPTVTVIPSPTSTIEPLPTPTTTATPNCPPVNRPVFNCAELDKFHKLEIPEDVLNALNEMITWKGKTVGLERDQKLRLIYMYFTDKNNQGLYEKKP